MRKLIDLTGKKIGRWTVLKRAENDKHKHPMWSCRCDCGNESVISGNSLRVGNSKSCGCLNMDTRTIHGERYSMTYETWVSMLQRCLNPKAAHYGYYGGRGIKVCDSWLDFKNFYVDMGERPKNKTLDRINVNGDYELSNCRWATHVEQSRNKRIRKDNTSGYAGVYWYKRYCKWQAIIYVNKKKKNLGYFEDKEKAIEARKRAEIKYWGKESS